MQTPKQDDMNPILTTVGLKALVPPSWISVNDSGYDVKRTFPVVSSSELKLVDIIVVARQREKHAMPPVIQDVLLDDAGKYMGDVIAINMKNLPKLPREPVQEFTFRLSLNRNARLRKRGHMRMLFEHAVMDEDMFGPPVVRESVSEFLALSLMNLRNRLQPVTVGVQVFGGGDLDEITLEDFEMTAEGIHGLIHHIESNRLTEDPYWRTPYILYQALMQQMEKEHD